MQDGLTNNADPHATPDYYVPSFPNYQYIQHEKDLSKLCIAPQYNQ